MYNSHFNIYVFSVEDIKLNSTVFGWPEHINTVFELSQSRLLSRRDNVEDDLRKRVSQFEDKLDGYHKEIEGFRNKMVRAIYGVFVDFK